MWLAGQASLTFEPKGLDASIMSHVDVFAGDVDTAIIWVSLICRIACCALHVLNLVLHEQCILFLFSVASA